MDYLESELRLSDFRVKNVIASRILISKAWKNPMFINRGLR